MNFILELKNYLFAVFVGAKHQFKRHYLIFFCILPIIAIFGAFSFFPYDISISSKFENSKQSYRETYEIMKKISKLGGYNGAIIICFLAILGGKLSSNRRLMIGGVAGFLGASAAGLLNNTIKLSGRPRPDARIELQLDDKFYGIKLNKKNLPNSDFLSFPSGHSATIFGAVTGIAVTYPLFLIISIPVALPVVFSRIYILDHYPSDVFVGSIIGIYFGLLFGLSAIQYFNIIIKNDRG